MGELRASAPVGVDFDSYALTLEWADRIQARAVDTEGMPPSGGPSPEEREVFAEWMACEVLPARRELESAGQICETPPCDGQIGDTDDGSEEARWHTGWHR